MFRGTVEEAEGGGSLKYRLRMVPVPHVSLFTVHGGGEEVGGREFLHGISPPHYHYPKDGKIINVSRARGFYKIPEGVHVGPPPRHKDDKLKLRPLKKFYSM
jgi:hypothetical protein